MRGFKKLASIFKGVRRFPIRLTSSRASRSPKKTQRAGYGTADLNCKIPFKTSARTFLVPLIGDIWSLIMGT